MIDVGRWAQAQQRLEEQIEQEVARKLRAWIIAEDYEEYLTPPDEEDIYYRWFVQARREAETEIRRQVRARHKKALADLARGLREAEQQWERLLPPAQPASQLLQHLHPSVLRLLSEQYAHIRLQPHYAHTVSRLLPELLPSLTEAVQARLHDRLQLVELFAGIGGLGAGLEHALNAVTVLQAEAVPGRRAILRQHFPLAVQLEDVQDLLHLPPPCSPERLVLAGGFPCRGASRANIHGPRGMEHAQTGLWSVMATLLQRWQPVMLIWENVTSLLSRGMDTVMRDCRAAGYVLHWRTLPASAVGAPHERSRLFGIALRAHLPPLPPIVPLAPNPQWLRWQADPPVNDPDTPHRRPRVQALGDAVVPLVAYNVGLNALRLLQQAQATHPAPLRLEQPLPNAGVQTLTGELQPQRGPWQVFVRVPPRKWVTLLSQSGSMPPSIGWVVGEPEDVDPEEDPEEVMLDVEMPGGAVVPYPLAWTRPLWPTLVATDGENLGGMGQYGRKSPGLNVLVQGCSERDPDCNVTDDGLLDSFTGTGIGPEFSEWVMGFPPGWTDAIAQTPPTYQLPLAHMRPQERHPQETTSTDNRFP